MNGQILKVCNQLKHQVPGNIAKTKHGKTNQSRTYPCLFIFSPGIGHKAIGYTKEILNPELNSRNKPAWVAWV